MADSKKTYQFINEDKWGASYIEFFVKKHDGVSYTIIRAEECKAVVFESGLTEQEKEELLSRDGEYEIDYGFCIIETNPAGIDYEVVMTGEEVLPESERTPIPAAVRDEFEQIEEGEIELGEYSLPPKDTVWVDTTAKLVIQGKVTLYDE